MSDVLVTFLILVTGIILITDRQDFGRVGYFLCLFCGNAALFVFVVRVLDYV